MLIFTSKSTKYFSVGTYIAKNDNYYYQFKETH